MSSLAVLPMKSIFTRHGFKEVFYPQQGSTEPFYGIHKKLGDVPLLASELDVVGLAATLSVYLEVTPFGVVQLVTDDVEEAETVRLHAADGSLNPRAAQLLSAFGVPAVALRAAALADISGHIPVSGNLEMTEYEVSLFEEPFETLLGNAWLYLRGQRYKQQQVAWVNARVDGNHVVTLHLPRVDSFEAFETLARDIELFRYLAELQFLSD